MITLHTTYGDIGIELDFDNAPKSAANFLQYARDGFYTGTIFHRVIDGFMIQGGGMTSDLNQKPTRDAIENEADNGLKNQRGTIAMARTSDPDSATSQFFINLADNHYLNHGVRGAGYAVFGRVADGKKVVHKIAQIPTGRAGPFPRNVPRQMVIIQKASVLKPGK